jgi:hypothetical protein
MIAMLAAVQIATGGLTGAPGQDAPAQDTPATALPGNRVQPDGRFLISMGERAVVRFDAAMKPTIVSLEKVDPASAGSLERNLGDGLVSFTLGSGVNDTHVLRVESGLADNFDYGAVIGMQVGQGFGLAPTSTCTIPTGKIGLETWPDPPAIVLLGPFTTSAGQRPSCATRASLPED